MDQTINKFKKLFNKPENDVSTDSEIGFRIFHSEQNNQIRVRVIGGRNWANLMGNAKPEGYLVKVTVFPDKEKFETKLQESSWPTFNEEFSFDLGVMKSRYTDLFKNRFVSLTVYAVMKSENQPNTNKPKSTLKRFFSFDDAQVTIKPNPAPTRRSYRHAINARKTLGAVTYNLNKDIFTQRINDNVSSTPDIWRDVQLITTGILTQSREGKNGNVEVTLQYSLSEGGENDVVEITVSKFRCSLQTMQEHEKLGGQLYIKITAFEFGDLVQKMKSDKFNPTISLKLVESASTLRARVDKYNLDQMKIMIRLLSQNMLGQKTLLGKIEITNKSKLWKEIVESPSVPVTKIINFD